MIKFDRETQQFVGWEEARDEADQFNPWIDKIYKEFLEVKSIQRFQDTDLDMKLHIDAIVTLTNGMRLHLQEKTHQTDFKTHTIEYMSDHSSRGEWFNGASDLYFEGYGNPKEGFTRWVILNFPYLKISLAAGKIKPTTVKPNQNVKYGTSNFWAFNVLEIQEKSPESVFAISGDWA